MKLIFLQAKSTRIIWIRPTWKTRVVYATKRKNGTCAGSKPEQEGRVCGWVQITPT